MPYLENFSKKQIIERFKTFPTVINDSLDMHSLFSMHNFLNNVETNTYKDHIEYYGFGDDEELPYFDDNYFVIHIPKVIKGKSILFVDMHDYDEEIDRKERRAVKKRLREMLPTIFNVNKIVFSQR